MNIRSEEAERLARELAGATGETLTQAVIAALRERLERVTGRADRDAVRSDLRRIQQRFVDGRSPGAALADEIIGYDEYGVPG